MGNKMDYYAMTSSNPKVNFMGRSAENNGVPSTVDCIAGIPPYKSENITVALGGSLGSTFLQKEDFYTGIAYRNSNNKKIVQ